MGLSLSSGDDVGLYAEGPFAGVWGQSDSTEGVGVSGLALATSAPNAGVFGRSISGYGVYGTAPTTGTVGIATADSGETYGVYGRSASTTDYSTGVYGYASATSGKTSGVWGRSDSDEGRAVVGHATASSGGTIGVYGRSDSPDGYGGYFKNTAGGVALKAGGSGIIQSTADTEIAVSPLKMVAYYGSNVDLRPFGQGRIEVRPNATGSQYVYLPVDLPSVLFGTRTKLKSARICYECDQTASFITKTSVRYTTDSGSYTNLISDDTNRTNTTWECYTLTDTTPGEIEGSLFIRLVLSFAGTGSSHDIRIGKITLTLTEE
jgi:hypothetical protein